MRGGEVTVLIVLFRVSDANDHCRCVVNYAPQQQLPPVRNQAPPPRPKKKKRRRTKAAQPSTATTGSDRISSYDYSSWDRFDVVS